MFLPEWSLLYRHSHPVQLHDWSSVHHCNQLIIISATVECYSQQRGNSRHDSYPSDDNGAASTSSSMARTELEVVFPDTGRQQCGGLPAADSRSTAHCQLELHEQRHMIRRNLWMRTTVDMVLLKPRPIRSAKNTKRPHEIPSIENVVDNASEVKPTQTQTVLICMFHSTNKIAKEHFYHVTAC